MKITLVERPPARVACLRFTGPFGEPRARFWRSIVGPWLAEHGLLDCPRYGVTLDDLRSTPQENCRYDACVELPAGLALPGARETQVAGGHFAITRFRGSAREIGAAWEQFVGAVAQPGHRVDAGRHPYEHYPRGASFDPRSGVFACELCLPLMSPKESQ